VLNEKVDWQNVIWAPNHYWCPSQDFIRGPDLKSENWTLWL